MKTNGTTTGSSEPSEAMGCRTRELASPPGKVVLWTFKHEKVITIDGGIVKAIQVDTSAGKTAFEAAAKLGLLLSQCTEISWE